MHVDETYRPPSALLGEGLDPVRAAAGAALTLAFHVLPLVAMGIGAILTAVGILDPTPEEPEPPPVEEVIAARFVTLGRPLDPHQLPDRVVPILRTDTPDPRRAPSKREEVTPPPPREERERQRRSVEDVLQRLSDDAQHFAERDERRLPEGDEEGIEGGTARTREEGDIYAGRLAVFFRRGWTVPSTIDADALHDLSVQVSVHIGSDLRIESFRLTRPSGDAVYDQSVIDQLQRLVDSQSVIPPPPDDQQDQYLGRDRAFAFRGRDAR